LHGRGNRAFSYKAGMTGGERIVGPNSMRARVKTRGQKINHKGKKKILKRSYFKKKIKKRKGKSLDAG